MAFFLIGRGPDDDLHLLSSSPFESRQDAMAELSRLSADSSFDQWDADVFVMDLGSGVPVLLVRPAAEAAAVPQAEIAATGDAYAWEADLPAQAVPVPVAEVPTFAEGALEPATWTPPEVVVVQPVEDAAMAEAIAQEAAPAEEVAGPAEEPEALSELVQPVEPEPAEVAEPSPAEPAALSEEDENDELRAAILRTTLHMTAEGIVAPESIMPEAMAPDISATPAESPQNIEPEAPLDSEATVSAAWPWDTSAETAETESGVAPEVAGVYDALQEPADELPEPDVEAVLRRPVMMGSYDLETDASAAAADSEIAPQPPMSLVSRPEETALEASLGEVAEQAPEEDSDFILDLEAIQPVALSEAETEHEDMSPGPERFADVELQAAESPSRAPAVEVEPEEVQETVPVAPSESDALVAETPGEEVVSPLQDYTCEDCVYVATCPNRDQRLPKDCGSFQWR